MSSRRLRQLGLMLALSAAAAALAVFGLSSTSSTSLGRKAPVLPSEHLAGASTSLPSLLSHDGGRSALVVFWASWCVPCTKEAPELERFSESASGRGRIVGVDWSDGRSGARAFIRRYRWNFPNVRDAEGTVGNAYGMTGLPTTFVLDGRGRIRTVLHGPQTEGSLRTALENVERG